MMTKFQTDLATGEAWEVEAIRLLTLNYPDCDFFKMYGNFPDYDLMCNNCGVAIECKDDIHAAKSGNFCFEQNMFDKTKADFLLYKTAYGIFLARPKPLYGVLQDLLVSEHPDVTVLRGGDGNRQTLYLARVETMTAIGIMQPFDLRVIGLYQLPPN